MTLPLRRSRGTRAAMHDLDASRFLSLSEDALCTVGMDGCVRRVSPGFTALTAMEEGAAFFDAVHPEDLAHMRERLNPLARSSEPIAFEARVRGVREGWSTLHWRALVDSDAGEITLLGRESGAEQSGLALFEVGFSSAPVGMAIVGLDGGIQRANAALAALTQRSEAELVGMHIAELVSPADVPTQAEQVARLLSGQLTATTLEQQLAHADGARTPVKTVLAAARRADGTTDRILLQVHDVGERERLQQQLRFESEHDSLTGLLNRNAFTGALVRQLAYSRRYEHGGVLAVIDLDGFHTINDELGTAVGDGLLRTVAGALRERLRETDCVARLGSDEFGVLFPELDADEGLALVEDLLKVIAERTLALGGSQAVHVTASAGIALLGAKGAETTEDAFTEADLALAAGRDLGPGRATLFDAAVRSKRANEALRRTWAEKLRSTLEAGSFLLDCQPIVTAASGEPVAYELFLRMLDDDGSLVRPNTFLSVAERFGLMRSIDEWVIAQAIGMAAARFDGGNPVTLSVNVSGESVADAALLPAICDLLMAHPEAGQYLVFELAERTIMDNLQQSQRFIARLGEFGCRFALDDFGQGFGSLSHLKHLAFDYVKLDGSFTRELPTSAQDQAIVQALVGVARSLGRTTVAECVEDDDILAAVQGYGIELAQGLHVGRPARVADVLGVEISAAR